MNSLNVKPQATVLIKGVTVIAVRRPRPAVKTKIKQSTNICGYGSPVERREEFNNATFRAHKKKAGAAKHSIMLCCAGLLFNEPPADAGCSLSSHPKIESFVWNRRK
jgi:hypothetical protein